MKVILTVEAGDCQQNYIDAEAETYEQAKAAAEAKVPEGWKALVIRVDQ